MRLKDLDLNKYVLLNNDNNVCRIPSIYKDYIIRISKNKTYYFYCLCDKYDEIQDFFNKTKTERMSILGKIAFSQKTEEELEDFKRKISTSVKIAFSNMSEESKDRLNKIKSENHKKYWQSVNREELGRKISEGKNNMSEEDKKS